jgi:ribose transport system substrate-binding protein
VQAAERYVAARVSAPNALPVTTPLTKAPPKGKSVVCVEQNLIGDEVICAEAKAAAQVLGWNLRVVQSTTDPQAVAGAMAQAVQLHPDGVIQTAVPISVFPTQIQQLHAAGIPYVTVSSTDRVGPLVLANVNNVQEFRLRGAMLAQWAIAKSGGKAQAVITNLAQYPTSVNMTQEFLNTMQADCSACKASSIDVQVSEIGTSLPGRLVSFLQAHPGVHWIVLHVGSMIVGVPQALAAAGLGSSTHILTESGTLDFVRNGQEEVNTPDDAMVGWLMMDALARKFEGLPIPENQYATLPTRFVTKANVGNQNVPYVGVPNYQELFKKLWLVG